MPFRIYIKKSSMPNKKYMFIIFHYDKLIKYGYFGHNKVTRQVKGWSKPEFYDRYIKLGDIKGSIGNLNKKYNKKNIWFHYS
jgi:hypothetical protein